MRRRRRPILNHLQHAMKPGLFTRSVETAEDEIDLIATMPADQVASYIFRQSPGDWEETMAAASERFDQAHRARNLIDTPVEEEPVVEQPRVRPPRIPTPHERQQADLLARAAAIEANRLRGGS